MTQGNLARAHLAQLLDAIEGLEHVALQGESEPLLHLGFFELFAPMPSASGVQ